MRHSIYTTHLERQLPLLFQMVKQFISMEQRRLFLPKNKFRNKRMVLRMQVKIDKSIGTSEEYDAN
jgi:hypothetical protein